MILFDHPMWNVSQKTYFRRYDEVYTNELSNKTVPVKCFDSGQKFLVVPAVDKDLSVVLHRLGQH